MTESDTKRTANGETPDTGAKVAKLRKELNGRAFRRVISQVALVLAVPTLIAAGSLALATYRAKGQRDWTTVAVLGGIGAYLLLFGVIDALMTRAQKQVDKELVAAQEVDVAAAAITDDSDIGSLLQLNRTEMTAYQIIARGQAQRAFPHEQHCHGDGLGRDRSWYHLFCHCPGYDDEDNGGGTQRICWRALKLCY